MFPPSNDGLLLGARWGGVGPVNGCSGAVSGAGACSGCCCAQVDTVRAQSGAQEAKSRAAVAVRITRDGFHGHWSRRITDEHRLVYEIVDDEIRIAACRYHYGR